MTVPTRGSLASRSRRHDHGPGARGPPLLSDEMGVLKGFVIFIVLVIAGGALLSVVGLNDSGVANFLLVILSLVAAVALSGSSGSPRERQSGSKGFNRRNAGLSTGEDGHHFIAMRAKEEGDYEKTLNVGLDMWDRFGLTFSTFDAIEDGFIVWRRQPNVDEPAYVQLSLDCFCRAREQLPSGLGDIPPRQVSDGELADRLSYWAAFFNIAERGFGAIDEQTRRTLAAGHFDDLCDVVPDLRRDYLSKLERLHTTYGVGDMGRAWAGM